MSLTLEQRVTLLESKLAAIQADMVTRGQMSALGKQYDDSITTFADTAANLEQRLQAAANKIAALGFTVRGSDSYIHSQSTAATTWTINHSLNWQYLHVLVVNGSNVMVDPSTITVTFVNLNTATLTFTSAVTGTAVLTKVGVG